MSEQQNVEKDAHLIGHPRCLDAGRHVCKVPSGRICVELGCENRAGTLWGPLWCPDCDSIRMDRISRSLDGLSVGGDL